MFYIEVQLEKDGRVMDAKLAHLGEAPVVKLIFWLSPPCSLPIWLSATMSESLQLPFGFVIPGSLCMTPDASLGIRISHLSLQLSTDVNYF